MYSENQLKEWLSVVLNNENIIENYTIKTEGSESGVSSDIIFVTISNEQNKEKPLHLALKILKQSETVTSFQKLIDNFKTEVKLFEEIIPQFDKLQNEVHLLSFFPKYYGSLIDKETNTKIIAMENLNKNNYEMWPKNKPLTSDHTKMVLNEYAKLHALSFALKDKHPQVFKKLTTEDMPNNLGIFAVHYFLEPSLKNFAVCKKLLENCLTESEVRKLDELLGTLEYVFGEMYREDPEYSVICHGDCWNNNLLFKYNKQEQQCSEKKLESVKIVDWQCTLLSSPVFDVSYFFYTTSGKDQFTNPQEYLNSYYESLATYLTQLGADPEKLYPREKLDEHWNKFSRYGFAFAPIYYKLLRMPSSALNVEQMSTGKFEDYLRVDILDENEYKSLIVDLFKCFLRE